MRIPLRAMLVALVAALLALTTTVPVQAAPKPRPGDVQPLERAHAHNDYEHDRPLLDALDQGFTSVEADVWLVDGQLYLGHDAPDLSRTYAGPAHQRLTDRFAAARYGRRGNLPKSGLRFCL